MIKFFRRIRQNLFLAPKNGKPSLPAGKYLKYAIGEIILVVIGILIALQINNWNEHRKLLRQEKETIASLKLEFQKNLSSLEGNINAIEGVMNAGKELLDHTDPNYEFGTLENVDSLIGMTTRMVVWDPSLYTLGSIKSSGNLSSLTNDELKILLIEWESFYGNLLDWGDFYVGGGEKYFEYLLEHSKFRNISFAVIQYEKSKFKQNNEQLLREPEFENILVQRVTNNAFMLLFYKEARDRLTNIITRCEAYEN